MATGDGNTKRFFGGQLRPGGCDGSSSEAAIAGVRVNIDADGVPQAEGKLATPADGDRIPRVVGAARRNTPSLATSSKWYNAVLQNGEVWTPYTSRRFLPAQYLGLMLQADGNVDAAIARRYSLRDVWKLLDTELEKLIFMEKHWRTAFAERRRFLPVSTVQEIFREYLDGLEANLNDKSKCSFKKSSGEYWRRIQGEGRVVLWTVEHDEHEGRNGASTATTTVSPSPWLEKLNDQIADARSRIQRCSTYDKALTLLRNYLPKVSMGTFRDAENLPRNWLPKAWKQAFKKQGAYYTLKSLVVNCHVRYTTEEGPWSRRVSKACDCAREGLDKMAVLINEDVPAYVVHAILKKSIEASRFDIAKFLRSVRR
jgi:hypothetical protein